MLAFDDAVRQSPLFPGTVAPAGASSVGVPVASVLPDARAAGLQPGDRILEVGGVDLQGVSEHWQWRRALRDARKDGRAVELRYLRGDAVETTTIELLSYARYAPRLVASVAFGVCAVILGFAGRGARLPLLFSATYLATAILLSAVFTGGALESWIGTVASFGSSLLVMPLSLITFLHLREGSEIRPIDWIWPWAFAVIAPLDASRFGHGVIPGPAAAISLAVVAVLFSGIAIVILVRAHRDASPVHRRKLRWILLGFYIAIFVGTVPEIVAATDPAFGRYTTVTLSGIGLLPICVLIGIFRHDFLDVDRVWSVALGASLLSAGLLVGSQTIIPRVSGALQEASGASSFASTAVVMLGVSAALVPVIAALVFLARRTILAEQWELRGGVTRLVTDLSDSPNEDQLANRVTHELSRLFAPSWCTAYFREDDLLRPRAHVGAGAPVSLRTDGPLAAALEAEPEPVSLGREVRALARLGSFQRAALESLGANAAAPIVADGRLVGLVALGGRRSGESYTATDEALLRLVTDKLSSELRALRQKARIDALAPFRPVGPSSNPGRTEASVLFVDLRGYSELSTGMNLGELRAFVGGYSSEAAQVVTDHGGEVYAWSGDEIMAIFGAWDSLPHKETAAVRAARAILDRVASLRRDDRPVSAGIGIATGEVFLDDVEAADRVFAAALGPTTNLASKLQAHTREIEAAIAIDRTTWIRSGQDPAFLSYLNRNVPGIPETQDLYVLPLDGGTGRVSAS